MLELKDAGKKFDNHWLFKNLNLKIQAGDFISILGPSGCGKSTLLRILAGLDQFSEGRLQQTESSKIGFVFQSACLLPWLTVSENVAVGIQNSALPKQDKENQIQKILKTVKLSDSSHLFPHQLSGGMQMRVSIARALVNNVSVLFLDEPFSALDDIIRFELQEELLEYWKQHNMTVFFVTHSINESVFLSQKLWLFPQGQQTTFQEHDLKKRMSPSSEYRISKDYFETVTQLSEHLRGRR